jgi:hypothetical protein
MKQRILYVILSLAMAITASAQISFRSAELKRLYQVLAIDQSKLQEGNNLLTIKDMQIVVRMKNNTINHIGQKLFGDDVRSIDNPPIFDFLERYFLQLKYPPIGRTTQTLARDDQFKFLVGSIKTVNNILPSDGFGYSYDNHLYVAHWKRNGQPLLSVSFPVEYELISGENKIEADNNLMSDVKTTVIPSQSKKTASSSYYLNKNISSKLYYQKGQLLWSERHPAESIANLMLSCQMPGAFDVNITQVSYGFRKTTFSVPLHQWIAFCQNSGCQLYIGIESIDTSEAIRAVVFAVNEAENYNHVMTVDVPLELLRNQKGCIEAKLYPYVPTHNVRNLFANYGKSKPKTFVAR